MITTNYLYNIEALGSSVAVTKFVVVKETDSEVCYEYGHRDYNDDVRVNCISKVNIGEWYDGIGKHTAQMNLLNPTKAQLLDAIDVVVSASKLKILAEVQRLEALSKNSRISCLFQDQYKLSLQELFDQA